MNVLLVEDSETLRLAMSSMIPRVNRVYEADTIAAARRLLAVDGIDVIVLDLHLPDSPSWEETVAVIPEFRKYAAVLVCTGMNDSTIRHASIQAGADGFLAKTELALYGRLMTSCYDAIRRHEAHPSKSS